VVEPVVGEAGYDLEDLTISRAGRRFVVRVVVDKDGGLDLDAVADMSRAVSAALDAVEESGDELVSGEYQLEVSSPGVDRPLTLPRHWRRNIGRLVKVGPLTGRVVGVDDAGVMLDVAGERTAIAHGDLGAGRVQVEFNRVDEVADDELAEFDDDDEDGMEDEQR
jgi:ribosome maturation factor RimP